MKMKCIYISILFELAGEREINMILNKPDEDNEEIDKELKEYLGKIFSLNEVDAKFQNTIETI